MSYLYIFISKKFHLLVIASLQSSSCVAKSWIQGKYLLQKEVNHWEDILDDVSVFCSTNLVSKQSGEVIFRTGEQVPALRRIVCIYFSHFCPLSRSGRRYQKMKAKCPKMGIYKVKNSLSSIMVYAYMKQSVCIHTHTLICICIYFIHFSLFLLFLFIESLEVNQINWILLTFFLFLRNSFTS